MRAIIELIIIGIIVLVINCVIMLCINQLFDTTLMWNDFKDHLALTVLLVLTGVYFIGGN